MRRVPLPWTLRVLVLPVAASGMLAACGSPPVGPDYRLPVDAVVSQPAAAAPFTAAEATKGMPAEAAVYANAPLPAHWWRLYRDTQLDALIQQALLHNTDLRQALANLERAQAAEAEIAGATKPSITVSGGPSYGHASGLSMLHKNYVPPDAFHYSAGGSLSYQLDLWGQIRRAIEAAEAGSASAQAGLDLVRVNVAAGTARAYAEVCSTGLRLRSARESVRIQTEALGVTQRLQQAGRAGAIDTSRGQAQLDQLQAAIPPLEAQRQSALFRLSTLSGALPQDFPRQVADCETPPRVTGVLPVGDGAALLRRRPDIRQAERALAEATARIGVATADLYPKVSLGVSAGSAGPLSGFGRSDTLSWSLGPLISWTVPNTGSARARIAQAEASTRAAAARFDGVVLTALRETETALTSYAHELDRRAQLQAARDDSAHVAQQARALYLNGRTGYLDALDAERGLASSESALASSDALLADEQITLFLALGGGWEPDEAPAAAPRANRE